MTRSEIIESLKTRRNEIDALAVESLRLFGSWARDEASEQSDIDFLVTFSRKTYANFYQLKQLLEEITGRRVDLVTPEALKPSLREPVLRDAIDATPV